MPDGSPARARSTRSSTEPALKLLARHEELGAQEFWDRGRGGGAVTGRVITWSVDAALLEISAAGRDQGVHAGAAVRPARAWRAADVIAFGDMPNDLPMLELGRHVLRRWRTRTPRVLEAADHVAPGHDEDGVARVLAGVFDL